MWEELFTRHNIRLWGIASLEEAIDEAAEYRCIAFGLPYDRLAVEALPDDRLIDCSKRELSEKSKAVYAAIRKERPEIHFESYDDVDRMFGLREKGVSQKVLGHLAGLGWIGKSSLLVSPQFGPRIRLGTIFTKNPLKATGSPFQGDCGNCTMCAEICPSGAIDEKGYDVAKCSRVVTDDGKYKTFCGLCMRVCPQGENSNAVHAEANSDTSQYRR